MKDPAAFALQLGLATLAKILSRLRYKIFIHRPYQWPI